MSRECRHILESVQEQSLAGSPVLVGTGESLYSRLRGVGLEREGLVTVEASAFGKPQAFRRIPLQEVSAIEEPELGTVRVNAGAGESFTVRRGSPKAAQRLTQELARRKQAST